MQASDSIDYADKEGQADERTKIIPSGPGNTELGAKLNNPYALSNIKAALRTIGSKTTDIQPTHIYLRMRPTSKRDYDIIDSLDLEWEDQPIDYEVIYQGEYYHDPSIPDDEVSWLYATIPANYRMPRMNYEVLEEMYIPPYYSHLTYKAFEISGNKDKYEGISRGPCTPDCPNYPQCFEIGEPCDPNGSGFDPECVPTCTNYPCCFFDETQDCEGSCVYAGCYPGSETWPACAEGGGTTYTSCGCTGYFSTTQPSGKVRVEDTVLDPDGTAGQDVRQVKVRAKKDQWFSFIWHSTYTNNEGCFVIDHAFHSDKIKLQVVFKNHAYKIKALGLGKLALFAYRSRAEIFDGPDYSDLCIDFIRGGENTLQTRTWQAATVANSVMEFMDWELPLPDSKLRIWIDGNNNGAPMFGSAQNFAVCTDEFIMGDGTLLDYNEMLGQMVGNYLSNAIWASAIGWFAPDIVLRDDEDSDWFRATIYHELAHASHYALAGECYWRKVRAHIIAISQSAPEEIQPYGDPTVAVIPSPFYLNYPIIAVTESWGEHIGFLYTARKYNNPWFNRAERLGIEDNFIPEGIHYDLMDGIDIMDPTEVSEDVNLVDEAEGATLLELFSQLENETILGYRDGVISSTGVSGNIISLFSQYGYE